MTWNPPTESWRRRLLRRVVDRNPFYLISAACMLGGCLALTNSLSWLSLPLPRLLTLIATINVYEGMLIVLAVILIGRGLLRDGKILLILEAFFLVDVTFLDAEVVTANLNVGMLVSGVLLALAAVKLWCVMRAIGADLSPARFIYALAQVAALLAIPCVLRAIDHGAISPRALYATWWVVGLMPVVQEIATGIWGVGHRQRVPAVAAVYLVLPWISLAAHVGILHYVYGVAYYGAMAAPMLLGLTLLLNRATPESLHARANLFALRAIMPIAAIVVSMNHPLALGMTLKPFAATHVTTTMLAVSGAYLVYVYCFLWHAAGVFLVGGAGVALMYLFGPSVGQIENTAWRGWSWSTDVADRLVSKTLAQWGVVSVLASLVFLIIGAGISLSAPRPVEPQRSSD